MRAILVFCFIALASFTFSQKKMKVERLWFNANHGFNRYNEVGGQVQIFDQFLVGAYLQSFKRKLEPGLPNNPNALFSFYHYEQNSVNSGSLMIGFASPTPNGAVLSFLWSILE